MIWRHLISSFTALAGLVAAPAGVFAQGTGFIYQGRLAVGGTAVNGAFDFQFKLQDSATAGLQIGPVVTAAPVGVTGGVFAVNLDFGAGAFNGAARWLEIGVRTNGSALAHQVLSPRQAIAYTPLALYALTVADGSVTAAKVSGVLSSASIPALDASKITSGVLASNRLPANVAYTETASPAGMTVVSADAQDAALLARGYRNFSKIAAPAWVNGTGLGMPAPRAEHTAVWTGQEMMVWGGKLAGGAYSGSGGRYNPDADAWQVVSTVNAPSGRSRHTAVWTGLEMIVWGGFDGATYLGDGGRFAVAGQTWAGMATTLAPAPRHRHVAVWTGSRMAIWGGYNVTSGALADGAHYSPTNNVWATIPTTGAPAARAGASVVWTGTRGLIWGGEGAGGFLDSGRQLVCFSGVPVGWAAITQTGAPLARSGHTAVWTGTNMIVWGGLGAGGYLADGAAYNPTTDAWTSVSSSNAPTARALHNALWTGAEMVIFGGENGAGAAVTGAAYDPATDKWRTLSNPGAPQARSGATGVWTGSEAIFFGGMNNVTPLGELQRLTPQTAWYLFRKL